jgi:hypothetical protein
MAPGHPDASYIEAKIAHLRGLGLKELQARWQTTTGRKAPAHLPKHLLMRILAYRLQASLLGDLDRDTVRYLDKIAGSPPSTEPVPLPGSGDLRPGTVLVREWDGAQHRVMALDDGFAWNGSTYASLSAVARAITGTRWNGRRFFGVGGSTDGDRRR